MTDTTGGNPTGVAHLEAAAKADAAAVAHTVAADAAKVAAEAHKVAAAAAADASKTLAVLTGDVKTTFQKVKAFVKAHTTDAVLIAVVLVVGLVAGRLL